MLWGSVLTLRHFLSLNHYIKESETSSKYILSLVSHYSQRHLQDEIYLMLDDQNSRNTTLMSKLLI